MAIERKVLEEMMQPFIVEGVQNFNVSFFIVSTKHSNIKVLNLGQLSLAERAEKLQSYAENHRLVAVIESGDQMFAHTHKKYVEILEKQKLDIFKDKKVLITALTDEEAEQLGRIFKEHVLRISEQEETKETNAQPFVDRSQSRQQHDFKTKDSGSDKQIASIIGRMQNNLAQIVLTCLRKFEEARREDKKQQQADEKRSRIIKEDTQKIERRLEGNKRDALEQDQKRGLVRGNLR